MRAPAGSASSTAVARGPLVAIAGVAALAWLGLAAWGASPYGRYLDHDGLAATDLGPGSVAGLFVGAWLVMLTAMMLPTTAGLTRAFSVVVANRRDAGLLHVALVAGYLAVWTLAGVAAFAADQALHDVVEQLGDADAAVWVLAVVVLAIAGGYQLAPWKDACLDKCRSPRLMVFSHWHGRRPLAETLRLGWDHGRVCVGCCWALMLLMFAVGMGSLGWMALLATAMAVEKNARWGARLTRPIGFALLAAAGAVALANVAGAA